MFYIFFMLLLLFVPYAYADHSVLRNDTFNTLPDSNLSTFRTNSQIIWDHEEAQREGRSFVPFVYSGGIHSTAAAFTTAAFATEAFVPERVLQVSTAITYAAAAADICWTILSSDNNGIAGWTRVGTTAYYYQCEGDTTPNQPTLPPNSVWLMQVTIDASAITNVLDKRVASPLHFVPISKYASFAAAIDEWDDSGDLPVTLLISTKVPVTANVTLPTNITLFFTGPGQLDVATSVTVTHNGYVVAPCTSGFPRFVLQTAAVILLNAQERVCPEWWGAYTNGTNAVETTAAINQAFVASLSVHFSTGNYLVAEVSNNRAIWVGRDNTAITGNGASSLISIATNAGTPFCVSKVSSCAVLPSTTISNVSISGIRIRGTGVFAYSALYGGRGILVNGYDHVSVSNVWVEEMSMIGVVFHPGTAPTGAFGALVSNSHFTNDFYSGININGRTIGSVITGNTVRGTTGNINSVAVQVTGQAVVSNNTIYNSAGYGIFWGEGDYYGIGVVEGNIISRTIGPCILAQYHGPVKIIGNTLTQCGGNGGIVVAGGVTAGFTVPNENNVVANNTILQAYTYGIISGAANTIITGNNISWKAAYVNNTATTTNLDYIVVGARCEAGIFVSAIRVIIASNLIENCNFGIALTSALDPSYVTMGVNTVLSPVVADMGWFTNAGALITAINLVQTSPSYTWESRGTGTPTPPNVPWMRGAKIWKSDPVAGGFEGIINVMYVGTTLSVADGAGATSHDVASTANMLAGDLLIIYRDDATGTIWQTTILAITDIDTFTTTAGTPWATGAGSVVITQRWKTFGAITP